MPDKSHLGKPERWSAIIYKELHKYKTTFAAVSEVKFAENGSSRKGTSYTDNSRKSSTGRREFVVAFAVKNGPKQSMPDDSKLLTERLITLKFPFVYSILCSYYYRQISKHKQFLRPAQPDTLHDPESRWKSPSSRF